MSPVTVRVLSTAHDVADARLARIVDALGAREGVTPVLEGIGEAEPRPRAPAGAARIVARPRGGALRRVMRSLVLPFRRRADVLVVVDPDLVPASWLATRLYRTHLVVDLHEDYGAVARDRPWARGIVGALARVVVRAVLALAARAELTAVADDHVPPLVARNRLVVRNLPVAGQLPPAGDPDPQPRAVYVGDLRPSRGLHRMVDAVAATDDWSLDLVGAVAEVDLERFRADLRRRGLDERVRLHGRMPSQQAWQVAQGAWVGLCLLDATPAYVAAMPTKVYEYLAVGLPVLATPLPRVRSLLGEAAAGRCVSDAAGAASTLHDWSAHPDHLSPLRANARRWADEHLAGPSPFDEMAAAIRTLSQDHPPPGPGRPRP